MSDKDGVSKPPAGRQATIRDSLWRLLEQETLSAREISALIGVAEREVPAHLEHLRRSARRCGRQLQVEPAACHQCGFVFAKRDRLSRPGRCPRCHGESLRDPRFHLVSHADGPGKEF